MAAWEANLVEDDDAIREIVRSARRVAVLGIKPAEQATKPAYYVPEYLQEAGLEIVPVPVYFPEKSDILGEKVFRRVADIPGSIDLVDVFRRAADIPAHVPDLIEKRPPVVWFQLGIRNDAAAKELARAGIRVVQDRCLMSEHRRFA